MGEVTDVRVDVRPEFLLSDAPVGVGLKSQHYPDALDVPSAVSFFEIHAENHMVEGGPHRNYLAAIAKHTPISVHGVGMSLGSAEGISTDHLAKFKELIEFVEPVLVSEHLAWSVNNDTFLNDLLSLPLNAETVKIVSDNIKKMQDYIGRQILVENPSSYMMFNETDIPEPEYLMELTSRTGCGILLDVNNIYVSYKNMGKALGWMPDDYLHVIDPDVIGEIHLAGHLVRDVDGAQIRIDDHGSAVCSDVWDLYSKVISQTGKCPTLIEWDNNIPDFQVLLAEAAKAQSLQRQLVSTDTRLEAANA